MPETSIVLYINYTSMKKLQARCGGWVDRKWQEAGHLEEEKDGGGPLL